MELLPHQVEAIDYRIKWSVESPNFLIGDSMGVGKTATSIGMDFTLREQEQEYKDSKRHFRTLIICQKGGLDVWKSHLMQLGVKEGRILVIDPTDREEFDEELKCGALNYDYYIMHWDALIRLKYIAPYPARVEKGVKIPGFKGLEWDHLIADEVQLAKNRKAQRTLKLKKIKAKVKTGASGTPADDKPQDFWSVLNWLYPKEFSSYWRFFNRYLDWENHPFNGYRIIKGVKNIPELHSRIRPYYIRRKLTDVVDDMPDKTWTDIKVKMTPRMRRDYNSMEKWQTARLGKDNDELVVTAKIAMYMRLLQMTLGTCELDYTDFDLGKRDSPVVRIMEPSPKMDALMELIESHEDEDEQFVIFTNFRDVVSMVEARCAKSGIPVSVYHGGITNQKTRDASVAEFQSGKTKVFVGTIGAAGTSITLTAAHTLIFLDRNWNPSKNSQAEDRIWRIGQKNACQIINIIMQDTYDEPRLLQIFQKALQVKEIVEIGSIDR